MPKDKLAFRSHEDKDEEDDHLNEEDDEGELSRQKEQDDEDDDLRSDDMIWPRIESISTSQRP